MVEAEREAKAEAMAEAMAADAIRQAQVHARGFSLNDPSGEFSRGKVARMAAGGKSPVLSPPLEGG